MADEAPKTPAGDAAGESAPGVHVPARPGGIIRANEWNRMQTAIHERLVGHTHSGAAGEGARLGGEAIREDAELKVKGVEASSALKVNGTDVLAEVNAMAARVSAGLGAAAQASDERSYALRVGSGDTEKGRTFLNGREALHLRVNNEDQVVFDRQRARLEKDLFVRGGIFAASLQWTAITKLADGWEPWGGEHSPPGWCVDPFGFVHLRGLVKRTFKDSSKELGWIDVCQLPEQARPEYRHLHGVSSRYNSLGRIDIRQNGIVTVFVGEHILKAMERATTEMDVRVPTFAVTRLLELNLQKVFSDSELIHFSMDGIVFRAASSVQAEKEVLKDLRIQ